MNSIRLKTITHQLSTSVFYALLNNIVLGSVKYDKTTWFSTIKAHACKCMIPQFGIKCCQCYQTGSFALNSCKTAVEAFHIQKQPLQLNKNRGFRPTYCLDHFQLCDFSTPMHFFPCLNIHTCIFSNKDGTYNTRHVSVFRKLFTHDFRKHT